jgi:transposase
VRSAARNWLHDHVEQLERENAELKQESSELKQEKATLLERLAKLEEELRKSSRSSSKPPSSDGPAVPRRRKKPSTGRKPGGQPGHQRHERSLVPPEKVRTVVECIPERCDDCSAPLRGTDPEPERHQVTHLPPVEPITDEYRLHTLSCRECHGRSVGKLPAGVPTGAFGPSVVAIVAVLIGAYRQSKRLVPGLLFDLFGLRISVGAVVGCQQAASVALESPVAEAQQHVQEQPIKHVLAARHRVRRSGDGSTWRVQLVARPAAAVLLGPPEAPVSDTLGTRR